MNVIDRRPVPLPPGEQEDFTKEEKAFFESAPVGGYDGYTAPPDVQPQSRGEERFDHDTEMFHTSEPTTEYAFIDDTLDASEAAKLAEARALLAIEGTPTEEADVIPLQPKKAAEQAFDATDNQFFQDGVEKHGAKIVDTWSDDDGPSNGEAQREKAA